VPAESTNGGVRGQQGKKSGGDVDPESQIGSVGDVDGDVHGRREERSGGDVDLTALHVAAALPRWLWRPVPRLRRRVCG
jgi:hypothetical protein